VSSLSEHYLLDKKVKIYQPDEGYHASSDAVWLSSAVENVKDGDTLLDVGSGTGAVSLCVAERFKQKKIQITGIEIQPALAQAAEKSATANHFDFVTFENCNIFESNLKPCSFAHVMTNPPYALEDMPSPNKSKATAHNFQTADLKTWIDFCIKMIKPQGYFYIINRTEALDDILAAIHGKLGQIEIFPLHSKNNQPAKRIVLRARKDSKAPLVLHEPIIVHDESGVYTAQAEAVLRKGLSLQSVLSASD